MSEFISLIKATLVGRQFEVVSRRFGLYGNPETRRCIAERLGIRTSRVHSIEMRALKRLRSMMSRRNDLRDHLATIFRAQALEVAR